ncbi:mitofilin family membrane protein [Asticcacaulis sp. SL142]|uniref:COG4223 family protein n=1 Tax=Asticcacaulis sp. SL142 TaxID=2995155 RepID=UPI00226CBDCF|nr:mitofilin family membrane protein [Asticcacaulis sp. SL142]WAC47805.1 mitofilin family membrane protein [Asticcacaulis sp. SL142]
MTDPDTPPVDAMLPTGPDAANQNSRAVLKEKWARTPLMIAIAIPLLFIVAAFVFMGLGIFKDVGGKSAPATDVQTQAAIAELRAQVQALKAPTPAVNPTTTQTTPAPLDAPAAPVYSDPSALARLSQRIDELEARQREVTSAAAAVEAATALQLAARSAQPFSAQLTAAERTLTDPSPLAALRPHADKGVMSEAALAIEFPAYAAKAHATVKAPEDRNTIWSGVLDAIGSVISIRPLNRVEGSDVDATLRRAELRLNQGDLSGAMTHIDALPTPAQHALSPWLDQARARLLIDATTRRISETALKQLSATAPQTSAAAIPGGTL